jgi:fermentation-respiration switch protein FrsA (DUF1100 family)
VIHETPILFTSRGVALSGRLFRNTDSFTRRQPAVIATGSWLTVKEQMPATYARRMAARGYAAFVFDFAGFGESGGDPRQAEMPTRKMEDLSAAVAFLSTQSWVEPGAIACLAVCASSQYVLAAIARGLPIRSFASVAGWFHDTASVTPFYGGEPGVARRLARAAEAAERYVRTGEVTMAPAYRAGDERAGMHFELDYYANPSRGAISAWRNEMAEMSWQHWLLFDGLSAAGAVAVPTILVHADDAALPDNARSVHDNLRGPKRLAWLTGAQIDFYDEPAHVDAAIDEVDRWFGETLRG